VVFKIGNSNEDPLVHLARHSPVRHFGRVRVAIFPALRTYLPRETSECMVGAILPDEWTLVLIWNLAGADERGMESGMQRGQNRDSSDGHKCPSRFAADGFGQGFGLESKSKRNRRQTHASKACSHGS
jgi:hypothetical protein